MFGKTPPIPELSEPETEKKAASPVYITVGVFGIRVLLNLSGVSSWPTGVDMSIAHARFLAKQLTDAAEQAERDIRPTSDSKKDGAAE